MKVLKRQISVYAVYMLLGAVMLVTALMTDQSSKLVSMGTALLIMCALQFVRLWRIRRSPERLSQLELVQTEERLQFIAQRSRGAAFSLTILVEFAAMLVCAFLRRNEATTALGFMVTAQLLVYVAFTRYYACKY